MTKDVHECHGAAVFTGMRMSRRGVGRGGAAMVEKGAKGDGGGVEADRS